MFLNVSGLMTSFKYLKIKNPLISIEKTVF